MASEALTARQAADRLGVKVTTFYAWLGESDRGLFMLRGEPVTIAYFQSGRQGQGRIRIECHEVERLRAFMLVKPKRTHVRRPPVLQEKFPYITARLGRPD
jgi:hypothetical protein